MGRGQYLEAQASPGPYFKEDLPTGIWLRVSVPRDTTPEELSEFLIAHNIDVTPDRISIRDFPNNRSALISFQTKTIGMLLTWLLSESLFNGVQLLEFMALPTKR